MSLSLFWLVAGLVGFMFFNIPPVDLLPIFLTSLVLGIYAVYKQLTIISERINNK